VIGVTGATGHLGTVLMEMLDNPYPIGRELPEHAVNAVIHCAAPNYRDPVAVGAFTDFNLDLANYLRAHRISKIIVVGSWWQDAEGNCKDLLYTHLKNQQQQIFRTATHVIPYSIYGDEARPGRGFVPQLVQALNGVRELTGLSEQPRDFIHVNDVARALIAALAAPRGVYAAATWQPISPKELAAQYELTANDYPEYPTAIPCYPHEPVPSWRPLIDLHEHIDSLITAKD